MKLPQSDQKINLLSLTDNHNLSLNYHSANLTKKKPESVKSADIDSKNMIILDHNREKLINRRAHKRFASKRGAFALIGSNQRRPIRIKTMSLGEIALAVFKSKYSHMGKIIDISMEGIALYYIDSHCQPEETAELDIMFAEGRFYLDNIGFKIISDFEIAGELPDSSIKMRQLSLQFKDLAHHRKTHLDFFIKNHTIGAK